MAARWRWPLAVMLLAACGGEPQEPPTPAPRRVDLTAIADSELIAAVLDECQRPLRDRLDRIAATASLPDGAELHLYAQLPDLLRVVGRDVNFLLRHGEVHRLGSDTAPPTAAEATRVRQLRTLLDAALFGPLHRASGCRQIDATTWDVAQPGGASMQLELQPDSLLPVRIGEVRFVDYLRTSSTWMVKRAALDGLGECKLRFVLDDLEWQPDFFAVQTATPDATPVRLPAATGEPQSPDPFVVETAAAQWIVIDDPGSWPLRCERYLPLHEELVRQGQQVAGFPILWRDGEHALMAAPFRQKRGGKAFAAPADWTLRDVAAGRWLVVYPPAGDLAQRLADGERRLQAALTAMRLTPRGDLIAQPFLHLQEGVPAADKLAAPVVRMSMPVR